MIILMFGWRLLRQLWTRRTCGACEFCKRPWDSVTRHETKYWCGEYNVPMVIGGERADFPMPTGFAVISALCEDCWTQLRTPQARLPYYERRLRRRLFGNRRKRRYVRQAVLAGF